MKTFRIPNQILPHLPLSSTAAGWVILSIITHNTHCNCRKWFIPWSFLQPRRTNYKQDRVPHVHSVNITVCIFHLAIAASIATRSPAASRSQFCLGAEEWLILLICVNGLTWPYWPTVILWEELGRELEIVFSITPHPALRENVVRDAGTALDKDHTGTRTDTSEWQDISHDRVYSKSTAKHPTV